MCFVTDLRSARAQADLTRCSARRDQLPRIVHSWLRNYVACMALYFSVSGAWVYYGYWVFGSLLYKPGHIPPMESVLEQLMVRLLRPHVLAHCMLHACRSGL